MELQRGVQVSSLFERALKVFFHLHGLGFQPGGRRFGRAAAELGKPKARASKALRVRENTVVRRIGFILLDQQARRAASAVRGLAFFWMASCTQ